MENKKRSFQNDFVPLLVFLALSCICLFGLIAASLWGLNDFKKTILANATSTAFAVATQQKDVSATAIIHTTEQAHYEFIERFDHVSARWYVGSHARQYGDASYSIKDGVYIWNVHKSSDFSFWRDFYKGNKIKDFDVYLDTRFVESESQGFVCAGLVFRKVEGDWNKGAFVFSLCNDSHFQIQYYDRDGWSDVTNSNFIDFIHLDDWNRIEVSARRDHFMFRINNIEVFEMSDDRLQQGSVGIYLGVPANESALVWFDNFGYQSR
ncbi:MAG TPA: hypothetical protein VJM08_17260 [Anaerolineales bacterium]|nr:hypothetical protein [Anaerolineales bacterium]